jgi:hypothetical protein
MWKAQTGHKIEKNTTKVENADDDWDSGREVELISEKQQRWGKGKEEVVGVPLNQLASQVSENHTQSKIQEYQKEYFLYF